jgi:tetratricopeptide (TPR) repeat protein
VTLNLGFLYENLENYKKALDLYLKANKIAFEAKDPITYIDSKSAIAAFVASAGKFQDAIKMHLENLDLRRKFRDRRGEANDLHSIAYAYYQLNEKEKALDYYLQSMFISRNTGDKQGEAVTLNNLMFTFESMNQWKLAIFCGKLAVNDFQELRKSIQGLDKETQKTYLGTIEGTYRKLSDILIAQGRIAEAEQVLGMLKEEESHCSTAHTKMTKR